MTQAKSLMQTELVTVQPDTPLGKAINLLISNRISGLPVVDDGGELVGLLTEKDVMRLLYDPRGTFTRVRDLMTTEVRSFQADDDLALVCDTLMANHFRRVPILEGRKLVGLISRADLMPTILQMADEQIAAGNA